MHGVDIGDLQRDVAPAACLTNRSDGRGAVFLEKEQAVSQADRNILQPRARQWVQIVRRQSDVEAAVCQLHLPAVIRTMSPPGSRKLPIAWRAMPYLAPAA